MKTTIKYMYNGLLFNHIVDEIFLNLCSGLIQGTII